MFPFLWLWAPQVRLPFSGDVVQDIEPNLSAFFAGIKPQAGDARIEAQAFEVASYGDQLGTITELLLELAQRLPADAQDKSQPLQDLRKIHAAIQAIKDVERFRRSR
jgi:hypothetical protein